MHQRWFLLLTHATHIGPHIGAESTSSYGSGVAPAAVANGPRCDDHDAARTGRFTAGSRLTKGSIKVRKVGHVFVTILGRSYAILLFRISAPGRPSMEPGDKEWKQFS